LRAINAGGTGSQEWSLQVNLPPPPAITSAAAVTGSVDGAFYYQISASNLPTGFQALGLPPGLSLNAASGLISGVPTLEGVYQVALTASNAGGASAVFGLTISIGPAGSVPEGFALIPAGSFAMGDSFSERRGDDRELPVHTVYVSAFYMGRTEVTKAQWDEVRAWAAQSGYTDLPEGGGKDQNYPVTVSWYDAVKWLNAWSERDGLNPVYRVGGTVMRSRWSTPEINYSANGYRLPTEAEWEKAARGGLSGRRFPWGDEINHDHANHSADGSSYAYDTSPYTTLTYHPTYNDGTMPYTSPVGSFAPNGYGLYDMAGNVWEWCGDWYSRDYYSVSPTTDPTGPALGWYRISRGGGWHGDASWCRAADRGYSSPEGAGWGVGFRPARTPSP
jgi:formylglycine-generating enzyme required for sulfatase activity